MESRLETSSNSGFRRTVVGLVALRAFEVLRILTGRPRRWEFSRTILDFLEKGILPPSLRSGVLPVRHIGTRHLEVDTSAGPVSVRLYGAELSTTPVWEEVRVTFEIEQRSTQPPREEKDRRVLLRRSILTYTFTSVQSVEENLQNFAEYVDRQKDGLRQAGEPRRPSRVLPGLRRR